MATLEARLRSLVAAIGADVKALANVTVTWASLTGVPAFASRWPTWEEVTGKPATYAPSAHAHAASDITSGTFSDARIPTLAISKTSGLQDALNAKANLTGAIFSGGLVVNGSGQGLDIRPGGVRILIRSDTDAPGGNATIDAVNDSNSAFETLRMRGANIVFNGQQVWHAGNFNPATKANTAHTHAIGDVTGLQAALNGKENSIGYTPTRRNAQFISDANDITGFQYHPVVDGGLNTPNGSWTNVLSMGEGAQTNWRCQIAQPWFENELYFRRQSEGAWQPWRRLWHNGNFNPDAKANLGHNVEFGNITAKGYNGNANNGLLYLGSGYIYNRAASGDMEFYTPAGGYTTLSSGGKILTSADAVAGLFRNTNGNHGEKYRVGDDAALWDVTIAHTLGIRSQSNSTYGYVTFGADTTPFGWNGSYLCYGSNVMWHSGNSAADQANNGNRLGAHCRQITNWNDALNNGYYMAPDALNGPAPGWVMGRVTQHNAIWVEQEVWGFTDGGNIQRRWRRYLRNGAWSGWVRVDTPAIFVQSSDPGPEAPEGSLWIW